MATDLKLGNIVTPKGASLIVGTNISNDALDVENKSLVPYTIVITEEADEESFDNVDLISIEDIDRICGTSYVDLLNEVEAIETLLGISG